jgi:transcriptional regulator with XRE-family HTH domain
MAADPQLGSFLRMCRLRINKDATTLGNYHRLPCKVGRLVTQEELAEAVGISRSWYKMLESPAGVRSSIGLLVCLRDALELSPWETKHLFRLALPDLAVLAFPNDAEQTSHREQLTA